MGNQNTYFIVKVTLTGETNKTYASSYSVSKTSNTQNPETIKIGEETTFYLKHGETITISNLPYGVKYTVVENDYTAEADGGYEAAKYSLNNAADTTTSITIEELDSASESVKITNRKNTGIDMGVTLDSLPYILALAVAFGGAVVMITRKRHVED